MKIGDSGKELQKSAYMGTTLAREKSGETPKSPKTALREKARISGEAKKSSGEKPKKSRLAGTFRKLVHSVQGDRDVNEQIPFGEQKVFYIDGQEARIEGNGKLDSFITSSLEARENLAAKGIVTDLQDPRIQKLLADREQFQELKKQAEGKPSIPAPAGFNRDWKVSPSAQTIESDGKVYEFHGIELHNPELDRGFALNRVSILEGEKDAKGTNFVVLEGAQDGLYVNGYEKITASYDPETGKIKDESLSKWVMSRAEKIQ